MSSTIFYRFKSQKDYSRITFDASQIALTVFDVKRDIITTEKLGSGADFDLKIYNADHNTEYEDDAENIPKGSSIIVQRKPPSRGPGKGSAARYATGNSVQVSARQELKKPVAANTSVRAVAPPPPVPGSSEDEAIRAMLLASSDQWQETQDRMALSKPVYRPGARGVPTGPVPDRPLPQGYICYRCGQKGHYIQACPTNGDESFENRKRIKRTTGIPRSQLQKVDNPAQDGDGNVMVNAEGESVMFVPDSASWETYQKNTQAMKQDEIPEDSPLACGICKKLMKSPVSVPCCQKHYCEECVQTALLESDFVCPECGTKDILLDQLAPQPDIEKDIEAHLAAKMPDSPKQDELAQIATHAGERVDTLTTPETEAAATMGPSVPPMPPFDPMMMSMMGFPPMGFPPLMGFPPMGFPPMLGMPMPPALPPMQQMQQQQQQHQGSVHATQRSHHTANRRAHPYARPASSQP